MSSRGHVLVGVVLILAVAFAVRIVLAAMLPNMIWPDEIYQSLEQAHRVVFGYGMQPWEFRQGTRSWLLPGSLTAIMAVTSWLTSSVTAYLMACATFLSAISLAPVWATFRTTLDAVGLRGAVVAGAIAACWFELVFFAPKALNEVVAGNCLAVGVVLADSCVRAKHSARVRTVVVATLLLALATMLRVQLAIASLACFIYLFVASSKPARIRAIIAGAAVVVAVGLLDALTWRYPFQSFIENIRVNILVGRSSHYGESSAYAYFVVYARIWGLWGIGVLALAALGARTRPLFALCALAVLIAHVPIGHKEYRFLYPAMIMIIMLAAVGTARLVHWVETKRTKRLATLTAIGLVTLWFSASVQNAAAFHESKTRLARTYGPSQWHWTFRRGGLLAMQELGEQPDVCGIGMIGEYVFASGGYTYLHRNIPIYEVERPDALIQIAPHVNVFLVYAELSNADSFRGYHKDHCIAEVCIYRRGGGCLVEPGYSFNAVLQSRGD